MTVPRLTIVNHPVDEQYGKTRKRLFIGLVLISSLTVCIALILLWVIPYVGFQAIHPLASSIFGIVILAIFLLVISASFGLVLSVLFGKTLPLFGRIRGVTVKLFLPLMILIGRLVGISKEKIRSSFIQVNNELVVSNGRKYKPDQILLLMPHCLQNSLCEMRLTYNINNCKRCGKCPISGLLKLSDKYDLAIAIATGGTIARRIVVQKKPRLIIAVACERDLSSGIQDTYPLPVYGVLNQRPIGPCLDTQVSLEKLEKAIQLFLDPLYLPEKRRLSDSSDRTLSNKTGSTP